MPPILIEQALIQGGATAGATVAEAYASLLATLETATAATGVRVSQQVLANELASGGSFAQHIARRVAEHGIQGGRWAEAVGMLSESWRTSVMAAAGGAGETALATTAETAATGAGAAAEVGAVTRTLGSIGQFLGLEGTAAVVAGAVGLTLVLGGLVYVGSNVAGSLSGEDSVEPGPRLAEGPRPTQRVRPSIPPPNRDRERFRGGTPTGGTPTTTANARFWRLKGKPELVVPTPAEPPWKRGMDYRYDMTYAQTGSGVRHQSKITHVDRTSGEPIRGSGNSSDFIAEIAVSGMPERLEVGQATTATLSARGRMLLGARNEWSEGRLEGRGIAVTSDEENGRLSYHVRGLDENRRTDEVQFGLKLAAPAGGEATVTLLIGGGGRLVWTYVPER